MTAWAVWIGRIRAGTGRAVYQKPSCYHRDPPCHEPKRHWPRPSGSSVRATSALHRTRAQARLAEGARAGVAELSPAQGPDEGAAAQHGLRRGPLPEHRRVLEPRHGDVHDSGRRLHARLRLLRGAPWHADRARHRRARTRRPCDRDDGAPVRRHHVGRSRRPGRRRRPDLRGHDPSRPRLAPRVPDRGAHPRLPGSSRPRCAPCSTPAPTC